MAASKATYQFQLEGIGKLISDRFFVVPTYQRSYSWTSDHIAEYWDDINTAIRDGKSEYFLGTTVLTDTEDQSLSIPKNAKELDWHGFDADQRGAYVHRLGNMILLDSKKNKRIGNKPWTTKQPILATSSLLLAQSAASHKDWTPGVIEDTQIEIAKDAVKIWRRQP